MVTTAFNAITYANKLKDAGMATKIADVQAEEMVNIIGQATATKDDIKDIHKDMKIMELELKADILKIKEEMKSFIITTVTSAIIILGGLQTLFHFLKQ